MNNSASLTPRPLVVVVEDEALIRMDACEGLAEAGFQVVEAGHADEAAALLWQRAREVHAVFTDVCMPGSMDGMELAHLVHRSWPWIALLVASARHHPQPPPLPVGSRFLPKPYDTAHAAHHLWAMIGL